MGSKEKEPRVIALDGPAGSGKSTVARILADKLGFIHADSGAIYRTVTLALMERLGPGDSPESFKEALAGQTIDFDSLGCEVVLDEKRQSNRIGGADTGDRIRSPEVTERIGYIADNPAYRQAVNRLLNDFSRQTDLVVDGRDIGTEVFPNADFKFFLTADSRERARRRLGEYRERGMLDAQNEESKLAELEAEISARDARDQARPMGALKQAADAILIDTSHMDINAVVAALLSHTQVEF